MATPGVHHNVLNEDYHAAHGVSKSGLDQIARSPKHYFARYLVENRPQFEPTPAMIAGTIAHTAVLEPEKFDQQYQVGPDAAKTTKAWKEFEASLPPGMIGIKPEQRATAMAQRESVLQLPDVKEAFANGRAEVSAWWEDPETGVLCKCRPDFVHECDGGVVLVDLKTTVNAAPQEFARSVARYRYHVQAAYYSDGFKLASGQDVLGFVFVCVESDYPYAASALMLDEESFEFGRREYRRNLNTYAACVERGEWPGYSTSIETVSLPSWAMRGEEVAQ
jgi:hypothetical protein